jgi:hypothetical protein
MLSDNLLQWAVFSPDGQRIITASQDRTARVWDALTGKPLTPPLLHDQTVSRVAFSPDGHRVLTVSQDNLTRVWDADTGEPLTPPIPHTADAGASAFSGSGRYLLTMHPKYAACVWDLHQETSPPALLKSMVDTNETPRSGGMMVSREMNNLFRVRSMLSGLDVALHPISTKTFPVQAWFDNTSCFILLEGELAKIQVWHAASGMPITPQVQSRYALDEAASKKVKLPTVDAPADSLVQQAQLLAGSRLDGSGGWTLLELEELTSEWDQFSTKSQIANPKSQIEPGNAPLTAWHRLEAAAAEGASDWSAAAFHWRKLAALQSGSPEIEQRLDYSSNAAVAATATDGSYYDRRRLIPPRDPRADAHQIDLTAQYTAPLTDGFSDARRDVGLQIGVQKFGGVTFDVRGLIQLSGREPNRRGIKRSDRVTGILIGQRTARLHLLHTEQWAWDKDNDEIAALNIRYANGQEEKAPIQHAIAVAGDVGGGGPAAKQARLAWIGTTALANANQNSLRLFQYTWSNPHPDWEIAQVDLVSAKAQASYVLVAMTVE